LITFISSYMVLNLALRLLIFSGGECLHREMDLRISRIYREKALASPRGSYKRIEYYRRALERDPDYLSAYLELGEIYYDLGITYGNRDLFRKAIENFTAAFELQSDLVQAHHRLGTIYFLLHDFERCRRELETARRIDPGYAPVRNSLRVLKEAVLHKNRENENEEALPPR